MNPQLAPQLTALVRALEDLRGDIRGELVGMSPEDKVAIGQRLWALSRVATDILDPIKNDLRDQAVRITKGASGPCKLEAPDGSECTVRIPTPSVVLKKDADISDLKTQLGTLFDALIETVVTYKPRTDIRGKTASLKDPVQQKALMEALDVDPGTPKVFFKA